jgi:hypothetical protein
MIKNIITASAILGSLLVPSMVRAEAMNGSYLGMGAAVGLNGQGVGASLVGRLDAPNAPLSLRPQVTLTNSLEAAVGASVDLGLGDRTNLYVGGGAAFRDQNATGGILTVEDDTVGYAQLGLETLVSPRTVLYLDTKIALTDEVRVVPTVGLSYKF